MRKRDEKPLDTSWTDINRAVAGKEAIGKYVSWGVHTEDRERSENSVARSRGGYNFCSTALWWQPHRTENENNYNQELGVDRVARNEWSSHLEQPAFT